MKLNIRNTFNKELPSDLITENTRRKVFGAAHSYVFPKMPRDPELIHASDDMAQNLGLTQDDLHSKAFLEIFSGSKIYPKTKPYAMAYAGHQFGSWAGQLGDGRAINLFEVHQNNKQWAVQLKGAGPTPYSRQGDGLAVLRSSIREYLCSEAIHHLGVPTTRALSLMLSGDVVLRDVMYDGNSNYEKGAIVTRVAPSFLRFGNFELFAARQDIKNLRILTDYTLKYFYPELGLPSKDTYIKLFEEVAKRTLDMIIHWQRVGFVHGVMNTDNMSILGLTIDYGPYGWLEGFDFGWTPNTTDRQQKRYRYGNQPNMGLWNLLQLANALYPLVEDPKPFEAVLEKYQKDFESKSLAMMRSKIGLNIAQENDLKLLQKLEDNLLMTETDMTIFFRLLSNYRVEQSSAAIEIVKSAFYESDLTPEIVAAWSDWFQLYNTRLAHEASDDEGRKLRMDRVNPKYVLRNYMAQLAIDKANEGDYKLIDELFQMLKRPYDEQPKYQQWFAKRPEWARHKVGCSMLSCSS